MRGSGAIPLVEIDAVPNTGEFDIPLVSLVVPGDLENGTYQVEAAVLDRIFGVALSRSTLNTVKRRRRIGFAREIAAWQPETCTVSSPASAYLRWSDSGSSSDTRKFRRTRGVRRQGVPYESEDRRIPLPPNASGARVRFHSEARDFCISTRHALSRIRAGEEVVIWNLPRAGLHVLRPDPTLHTVCVP
jgi:hypothetical protein